MKSLLQYGFLCLLSIAILGCSEGSTKGETTNTVHCSPCLFHPDRLLNPLQHQLSFPLWFNDSLISVRQIIRIVVSEVSAVEDEENSEELRRQRIYSFDEFGLIKNVELIDYYDGMEIDRRIFSYKNKPDEYGFSNVKTELKETIDEDQHTFSKKEYAPTYLAYTNLVSRTNLYFLPRKKNWGVLSVDTILKASADDVIAYGSPKNPQKLFQIKNKVEEINSLSFQRDPKTNCLISIQNDQEPFSTKRTFVYGEWGLTRFVDSTFSGSGYLSRQVYSFNYQSNGLPDKLYRKASASQSEELLWKIEYSYEE